MTFHCILGQITHFDPYRCKFSFSGKELDEVVLVFPFGGDEEEIDQAAAGLNELNSQSATHAMLPVGGEDTADIDKVGRNERAYWHHGGRNERAYLRANSIIIRKRDMIRLVGNGWLNDNLIDFWMEW
jgi:hypothetical protein